MTGENIPSVMKIKERTDVWTSEDMSIKFVKKGSIIIGLHVSPTALTNVGHFLEIIDSLLSSILQCQHKDGDGRNAHVYVSIDFMDSNNEPIHFPMKRTDVSSVSRWNALFIKPLMNGRTRFAKCFVIIVEECKSWLVVFAENRVKARSNCTTLHQFINSNRSFATDPIIKDNLTNLVTSSDFDISALRSVIVVGNLLDDHERKTPGHAGQTNGDFVDRIREIRNTFMHTASADLSEQDYNDYLAEFRDIATRFEIQNNVTRGNYVEKIEAIDIKLFDSTEVDKTVERYNEYVKIIIKRELVTLPTLYAIGNPASRTRKWNTNCFTMELANELSSQSDNVAGQVVGGIAGGAIGLAADIVTSPARFFDAFIRRN